MGDRLGTPSAVGLNIFDFFLFARSTIKFEENEQIPVIKSANDHTTLNAPVLVRSLKLSNVGLGKSLKGDRLGKPRGVCLYFFYFFFFSRRNDQLFENEQITLIEST